MASAENHGSHIALNEFRLDRDDERLWGRAGPVRLGHKAFLVLSQLIDARGQLVTKDALFSSVWDGTIVSEAALTSVVKELRRALDDDSRKPRFIQSVYGRGYRLLEQITEIDGVQVRELEPRISGAEPGLDSRVESHPPLLYVPPFDDAGLGTSYPWLGDVLREELLLALSRFRDFRLVSDPALGGELAGLHRFGERDYQLTVRLLGHGQAISTFVRIVRLETQEIIWAERQQLELSGSGQDIELLISKIVAAALPRVHDDLTRRLSVGTEDAYGLYLRNKMSMRAADDMAEIWAVVRAWEDLLEKRPDFILAYGPLIYLYNTDFGYVGLGSTTECERARAYELARKAVRFSPEEPYLHTVSAWCHLWAGEASAAREHLRQAIELNPFHGARLLETATAWMFLNDLDQAAGLLRRCEELTPFVTEAPHEEMALFHLLSDEYDETLDCLQRIGRPTISSDLYGILAAGASNAPDLTERVSRWWERARCRWQASTPLDATALSGWALYHHPFQESARRDWVSGILEPALSTIQPPTSRTPEQVLSAGWSGPSAEAATS